MQDYSTYTLEQGDQFPYDSEDGYGTNALPPVDWAHRAARGVIAALQDRRGIKRGFDDIDEDVRMEIVSSLAEIIRQAAAEEKQ